MRSLLLKAGTYLWEKTPFKSVREQYLRLFLHLVRNKKRIASIEGMKFELDLGEMIDACLYLQRFERDVVDVIEKVCRPGSIVLDVGANIGAHALRFARDAGPNGRVLAFEPTDFAFKKLVRNVSLNEFGNVEVYQLALADQNVKNQEIHYRSSWRTDGKETQGTTTVDFVRLDDWLAEHDIDHVDIIKIDVDGNEYPVLNGARLLLAKSHPVIIMEIGAWHFEDRERNPLEILRSLGYKFWDVDTMGQYQDLEEVRGKLPSHDDKMAFSINVIAATGRVEETFNG